jgi:hypothetical protein
MAPGPVITAAVAAGFTYAALTAGGWSSFWYTLLAVVAAAETWALIRRAKGDTLSETVWDATDSRVPRAILAVFMAWLSWHLVADRRTNDEGNGRE